MQKIECCQKGSQYWLRPIRQFGDFTNIVRYNACLKEARGT